MRPRARSSYATIASTLLVPVIMGACGPKHRLADFDFRDRGLEVVSETPLRPQVLRGPLFVGGSSGDPVRDIVRAGARVVREIQAHDVQDRLDEASRNVDVGYILEDGVLERAARYLGARPTTIVGEGDFVFELTVGDYGIDAEDWNATAYFYIEADASLIEASSGTEVWRAEISANDPIGPEIWGPRRAVRDVVTAGVLADLSVEEIETALESLADFSARVITDRLRDDLRKMREDRRIPDG